MPQMIEDVPGTIQYAVSWMPLFALALQFVSRVPLVLVRIATGGLSGDAGKLRYSKTVKM